MPEQVARRRRSALSNDLRPHDPIPPSHYAAVVASALLVLFGAWGVLSYGGVVQPTYFLPTPTQVIATALRMLQDGSLLDNAWASDSVIGTGWAVASLLAVRLGLLLAVFKLLGRS